jgi:hypothetical protein
MASPKPQTAIPRRPFLVRTTASRSLSEPLEGPLAALSTGGSKSA